MTDYFIFWAPALVGTVMVIVSYLLRDRVSDDANAYISLAASYIVSLLLSVWYDVTVSYPYPTQSLPLHVVFLSVVVFLLSLFAVALFYGIFEFLYSYLRRPKCGGDYELKIKVKDIKEMISGLSDDDYVSIKFTWSGEGDQPD